MSRPIIQAVYREKLVAILRGLEPDEALALARALYAGGVRLMEVTFNQADASQDSRTVRAIASLRERLPGDVHVGAGTVVTETQLRDAAAGGATFIISPHTDAALIQKTRALGLCSMPGALTPSECLTAHAAGADFVKLFPAGALGPAYLKALRAPLGHIPFVAVGGVNADTIPAFFKAGAVGFGIGGNLVDPAAVREDRLADITALAARYTALMRAGAEEPA